MLQHTGISAGHTLPHTDCAELRALIWRENGPGLEAVCCPASKKREMGHHMLHYDHWVFFFSYLLKISQGEGCVAKTEICLWWQTGHSRIRSSWRPRLHCQRPQVLKPSHAVPLVHCFHYNYKTGCDGKSIALLGMFVIPPLFPFVPVRSYRFTKSKMPEAEKLTSAALFSSFIHLENVLVSWINRLKWWRIYRQYYVWFHYCWLHYIKKLFQCVFLTSDLLLRLKAWRSLN